MRDDMKRVRRAAGKLTDSISSLAWALHRQMKPTTSRQIHVICCRLAKLNRELQKLDKQRSRV